MSTMVQGVQGAQKSKTLYYNSNTEGPFIVQLAKKLSNDSGNIPHIHPANISRILKKNSVHGVDYIARLGRNIVQVVFVTFLDANSFIANFPSGLGEKYRCFIPQY